MQKLQEKSKKINTDTQHSEVGLIGSKTGMAIYASNIFVDPSVPKDECPENH